MKGSFRARSDPITEQSLEAHRSPMVQDSHELKLPRITILTPCLNGVPFIAEAIEGVQRQYYPDLEHIVLDAGSTDGTLALLARYADVTVVSEPDEGSHDALNKGVARATGEIVGFLNADDIYPDGVLNVVGRIFAADDSIDVVVGHSVVFEDDESGTRRILIARTHPKEGGLWLPELTFGVPGFCGCFFRRRVFQEHVRFRTDYFITADRRFLISLKLAGVKSVRLDQPTIWYRQHLGSATINPRSPNRMRISREFFHMAAELAGETRGRPQAHQIFRVWHAVEGTKLVVRYLLGGNFAGAAGVLLTLITRNPLWPIHLIHSVILRHTVRRLDCDDMRRRKQFDALYHLHGRHRWTRP